MKKLIDANAKEFYAVTRDGKVIIGKNIKQFCKKYKISQPDLWRLKNGMLKSVKGIISFTTSGGQITDEKIKNSIKEKFSKKFEATHISGLKIIGNNISEFCKGYGIDRGGLFRLRQGKIKYAKGFISFKIIEKDS